MTDEQIGIFMQTLRDKGVLRLACEAAGVSRRTIDQAARQDQEFRMQMDEAYAEFADFLEQVAILRSTEGVEEPVFFQGQEVGYKTRYSDDLLGKLLQARRPELYSTKVETTNKGEPLEVRVREFTDETSNR